jgi:single-strand DNA-binding protein
MAAISFSLAVTEKWKDKQGQQQSNTTWIRCTIWRKADQTKIAEYLKKGTRLLVEGRPTANAYLNKDNKAVGVLDLRVDDFEFLGGGQRNESGTQQQHRPAQPQHQAQAQPNPLAPAEDEWLNSRPADETDDLPF